jgi:peptide/nickel transport system substrate-binding protein
MTSRDKYTILKSAADFGNTGANRREFMSRLAAGGGAVMLGTSLAGCLGSDDGEVPNELIVLRAGDSDMLDPHRTTLAYSSMVMTWLYDSLLKIDFDGNMQPGLATDWGYNDDGTEWTVELRDDVTWHDGSEFTAEDVEFTYTRGAEMSGWSWAFGPLEDVEIIDDYQATFVFEEPYFPWENYYAGANDGFFDVIPKAPVEADEDDFSANPVGTGPYKFEEWVRDDHITLVRNDDWAVPPLPEVESEDAPLPEKITFRTIAEETPLVQELTQGNADVLYSRDFPHRERDTIENADGTRIERQVGETAGYVVFNMEREPTDEIEVRQALAHAIDKDRIINDIFHGLGQENWVPFSENVEYWAGDTVREEVPLEFDPDRSRELLESAGWEDTGGEFRERDGEELSLDLLSVNTPQPVLQLSEEMVSMFADIGVNADLNALEYGTAYSEGSEGVHNVFYATIGWAEAGIANFFWHSDNIGGGNRTFLDDPEIDALLEEATTVEDPTDIYQEVQIQAMETYGCQPIMTYDEVRGVNERVQNYRQHPITMTPMYHDMSLE